MRPPTLLLLLTTTLSLTAQAFPTSLSLPSALASLFHTKRDAPYATTANELTDGTTACRAVTLIYARGTNQAGNIGDASAVGPLFFNNISALIGPTNLAVQGVDYDADVDGYLGNLFGTSEEGVQAMTDLVNLVCCRFFLKRVQKDDETDIRVHKTGPYSVPRDTNRLVWIQPGRLGGARHCG